MYRNVNVVSAYFGKTRVLNSLSFNNIRDVLKYNLDDDNIFRYKKNIFTLTYAGAAVMGLLDYYMESRIPEIWSLCELNIWEMKKRVIDGKIIYEKNNKRYDRKLLPFTDVKHNIQDEFYLKENYLSSLDYSFFLMALIQRYQFKKNGMDYIHQVFNGMIEHTFKKYNDYMYFIEYEDYVPVINGHFYGVLANYMYFDLTEMGYETLKLSIESSKEIVNNYLFLKNELRQPYDLLGKHVTPNYEKKFKHNYTYIHLQLLNELYNITGDEVFKIAIEKTKMNWERYKQENPKYFNK